MTFQRKQLGGFGEKLAREHLESKGMKFLEANFECKLGEMDLIFRDGKTLVFVEVKVRRSFFFGPASLAVNPKKQKKITKVAKYYLQSRNLSSASIFQ